MRRPSSPSVSRGLLSAAAALAVAHGFWAAFQWWQLVLARRGEVPFCALGEGHACAALWDSTFARAVGSWSGIPVAGWGLVWSLAAFALPLATLRRVRRNLPPEPFWSATSWCALGGLASVALLGAVSLAQSQLCSNCAITYAVVVAYAALCFIASGWPSPRALVRGAPTALGAVVLAYALLLYPGLRTPTPADEALRSILLGDSAALDDEQALAALITRLDDTDLQRLSNARSTFLASRAELRPLRAVASGRSRAPVRITEFSDALCPHCAALHSGLSQLWTIVSPEAYAFESRQFPLHSSCNPYAAPGSDRPVRCIAARVRICLESHPELLRFDGDVFAHQADLDADRLYELARKLMPREQLERCVAARETQAKLEEDMAWAAAADIKGTPFLLVNGRRTTIFLPFLYAIILAKGDPYHPVFEKLPPPDIDTDHP